MFGRKKSQVDRHRDELSAIADNVATLASLLSKVKAHQARLGARPLLDVGIKGAETITRVYANITQLYRTTNNESPVFDQTMAAFRENLPVQLSLMSYFAMLGDGMLLAESTGKTSPSDGEAWNALLDYADDQVVKMRAEIASLENLKADHQEIWPAILDLAAMRAGTDDKAEALSHYRDNVAAHGDLPRPSAATLGEIIGTFTNSFDIIQTERQNLAMTIAARSALRQHD
ncbi:hypothetical protein [Sphingomonas jaspsi]|uniref:hypothetical protein n=1 Tax=Sphingomonas jaspsi TaxID=392409 RepID=UPI0004B1B125|nr:hypothetical protein [Sphingomonas jaspsi]